MVRSSDPWTYESILNELNGEQKARDESGIAEVTAFWTCGA